MTYTHATTNRGLYRSRDGVILGVCKGIAAYLDVSVFWTRVLAVIVFLCSGFFPIAVVYFVAALLMKPEPALPFETESDREFYDSYVSSPRMSVGRLRRTYEDIDRRLGRMESIVTARDYNWESRLNQ